MRKSRFLILTLSSIFASVGFFACDNGTENSAANSENLGNTEYYTAFTDEEISIFQSSFGFVIPFVPNTRYSVEEYEGYNGDLLAYEYGWSFITELSTAEACEEYVELLQSDEAYNYEYSQDGYFYFSRDGYFVKVAHYWMKSCYGLDVYVYSYQFEENQSSDAGTENDSSDTSVEDDAPVETVGLIYEDDSARGYYSVIGLGACEDGVVRIPDTYKGLPVMWIRSQAFYGREDITEVVIGNNVQYIESYAFALCSNLKSVTIGSKVESIAHHTFLKCEGLESVFIPQSVRFIENSTFRECTGLQSVTFENKTGWRTISGKKFTEEELSDGAQTATYLKETYVSDAWRRD